MADYDFAIIDDYIARGGTALNDFFCWGVPIENRNMLLTLYKRKRK